MEQVIKDFKQALQDAINGGFEDGLTFAQMAEMLREEADDITD